MPLFCNFSYWHGITSSCLPENSSFRRLSMSLSLKYLAGVSSVAVEYSLLNWLRYNYLFPQKARYYSKNEVKSKLDTTYFNNMIVSNRLSFSILKYGRLIFSCSLVSKVWRVPAAFIVTNIARTKLTGASTIKKW